MPFLPFFICTLVGTTGSVAALASLGYFISQQYETVQTAAIIISNIILSVLATALIVWVVVRHRRAARRSRG
jgi:membrane protein DedA with SNARE-associated domain